MHVSAAIKAGLRDVEGAHDACGGVILGHVESGPF